MSRTNNTMHSKKRTSGDRSRVFLFGIHLPPLAVVFVSIMLILALSQVEIASTAPLSGSPGNSQIAPLFTPEVQYWGDKIVAWSQKWDLDPNLVATVMQIESCGNPKARSSAGAMGLFQVMPYHFSSSEDPYQAGTNALRGLSYLKDAIDARGGNVRLGLAGYNAGITGAKQPENAWPGETVRYIYWGMGIYTDAQKGRTHSERLDEWLAHGGVSLCAQAAKILGIVP